MSLATDKVKQTVNPNTWNVKNITLASLVVGLLLVVKGAVAILISITYLNLDLEKLQTYILLELILKPVQSLPRKRKKTLLVFSTKQSIGPLNTRRNYRFHAVGRVRLNYSVHSTILGYSHTGVLSRSHDNLRPDKITGVQKIWIIKRDHVSGFCQDFSVFLLSEKL